MRRKTIEACERDLCVRMFIFKRLTFNPFSGGIFLYHLPLVNFSPFHSRINIRPHSILESDWIGVVLYCIAHHSKNTVWIDHGDGMMSMARRARYTLYICVYPFLNRHTIKTKISANFQPKMEQRCRTNYFFRSQFIYWGGTIFMFIFIPAAKFQFFFCIWLFCLFVALWWKDLQKASMHENNYWELSKCVGKRENPNHFYR